MKASFKQTHINNSRKKKYVGMLSNFICLDTF